MTQFTQENRLLTIGTPLGPHVFMLTGFRGTEAMSRLFVYSLDVLSANEDVKRADIVGKNVTWTVERADGSVRYFNGYVRRLAAGDRGQRNLRSYRLEVVPWLWFLTRTANCRVFFKEGGGQNVATIVKGLFDEYGFKGAKYYDAEGISSDKALHPDREFVVQYRETAFAFISRLLEDEGIFYYFRHDNGKHVMVLGDRPAAYYDGQDKDVAYVAGSAARGHISRWDRQYEFRSGKMAHTDYDFEKPDPDGHLFASEDTVVKQPGADAFELFDYPGNHATGDVAAKRIELRMQEEETDAQTATGTSNCVSFSPGGKFHLAEHVIESEAGKDYVVTAVEHKASDAGFGATAGPAEYSNQFTCIPAAVAFRPARLTPRPFVQGVQTAVVVGSADDAEIHTDKYGRIKVQFHWDRRGKFDHDSSCWVRVGTPWAGKKWGMIHIPRVGQEVIIDFLEGNPDRPIVVGSVYNAQQLPPYDLPANKTQSGIKSRSSLAGTPQNFNEIRFEDLKGKEQIVVHAERDLATEIEHNENHRVYGSQSISVGAENVNAGTKTETIYGDTSITVTKGNYSLDVQTGTHTHHVASHVSENYDASQITTVKSAVQIESTDASIKLKASSWIKLEVGSSSLEMLADGTIKLKGVNVTVEGSTSVTVCPKTINIKGSDSVNITPAVVFIDGTDITVNASGKLIGHGGTTKVKADGDVTIEGGTVKVNC